MYFIKTSKIFTLLIIFFTVSAVKAQNVLILYDDSPTNTNTVSLKNAIDAAGYTGTISSVNESAFNGTNPSLSNFDVVIRLNGTSYTSQITTAGQTALVDFVEDDGGAYVQFEWDAYQFDQLGQMQLMEDLILFDRTSGNTGTMAITEVSAQASHPVLANVPSSFSISGGYNVGTIHTFSTNPSTVLMTESSNDAVAIREFGAGCILGFHNAGNYSSYSILSDTNIQNMIIDFIGFCGFCGVYANEFDSTVSCFGYSDGVAGVAPTGGISPYSYEWSTGDSVSTLTGLTAGTYNVTIIDSAGCSTVRSIEVEQPTPISLFTQINNSVYCFGETNGSAGTTVSGGTPPFTYAWNNGETTPTATMLPGGNAIITVIDSLGCVFMDTALILTPDQLVPTFTIVPVECDGDDGGSITVSVTGGAPPYLYNWSTGSSNNFQPNLVNGLYNITITDNAGCILEDSVILNPLYLSPQVDLGEDLEVCVDWPVKVSAGNPGASYAWSNGSPLKFIYVALTGDYWVEVTNDSGCTSSDTIHVESHTCLGINDPVSADNFSVYPIPSNGFITIELVNGNMNDGKYRILDVSGRLIKEGRLDAMDVGNKVQLDLSALKTGNYILGIENDNQYTQYPIILR